MGRLVDKVGIVGRLIFAEVDLAEEVGFHQQTERAVNGGARGFSIHPADTVEEFVSGEMFILGKGHLDDGVALIGPAQSLASDEVVESFLNGGFHGGISIALWQQAEAQTHLCCVHSRRISPVGSGHCLICGENPRRGGEMCENDPRSERIPVWIPRVPTDRKKSCIDPSCSAFSPVSGGTLATWAFVNFNFL
jgi:hypothetical protein